MDYKNTLNLPRTDFAMKADLVAREPQRLAKWEKENLYARIQEARATAPKFVLHDGPPFANGDVHIGTALNKILKDIIIKYKTLRGFSAPYIPGWDCHGLPIEFKVSQELRKQQRAASVPLASPSGSAPAEARQQDAGGMFYPVAIRSACDAYARKYIDLQRTQFKRLGVLGDWDHPYLTLNKEYEADELRLFADIVEKGFVYRGKKPVYWSIPCRTALAEAEVEYNDHTSTSVYVKFPVVGQPGTFIIIWTTTPWTLPANLAVAYNSTFSYSQVMANGETYIVSTMLLGAVSEKCKWDGYQIIRSLEGTQLAGLEYQHPFVNRTGKLHAGDNFVTNDTGTGFVHIAPGHGLDDYNLGRQFGLPIYSPVDDDGKLATNSDLPLEQQFGAELIGKSILEKGDGKSEANEAVLAILRTGEKLVHAEDYKHSYPFCWRSKTPVIFRAMDQWFIRIDHNQFRQTALAEIDRVAWIPDWGVNRIKSAVQTRPDWCISRQRTWGVPIPAFYDAQGEPILNADIVRSVAALIEQHGSNVWFEKTAAELWALVKPKNWTGADAVAKSQDTLDVWIDSGSSSRAVLSRRDELHHRTVGTDSTPSPSEKKNGDAVERVPTSVWQADLYLEGSDQHRGWFQSSLLLSLAGNGAAPYKTVLTHGFMVDEDREKISKSKQGTGAYLKPQTAEQYIKDYGVDVIRLWVASQDYRNDIVVSEERLKKVSETYRGIRNALRYQLSNLYDFHPSHHAVADKDLTGLDRWILNEFAKLERDVLAAYDKYEFHVVYQRVSQFVSVELSSQYHDLVKDRLYTDPANSPRRRSTQTALCRLVKGLCRLLSPILAFTADEAWEFIPGVDEHVHCETWTPLGIPDPVIESNWTQMFKQRELILPKLEKARQSKTIGKALDAKVVVVYKSDPESSGQWSVANAFRKDFQELLNVSEFQIWNDEETSPPHSYESFLTEEHKGALYDVAPGELFLILVAHADGAKCERCWHFENDVGQSAGHPTLCSRCVEAVVQFRA